MKHYTEAEARAIVSACGELCSRKEAAEFMAKFANVIGEDTTIWDVWASINTMLHSIAD